MSEATIQLRDKGAITLPMSLRRKYGLRAGDVFAVADLGEGVLMLTPKTSRVAALGDKVAEILQAEGVTVEEMLQSLGEERERYYREHYVNDAIYDPVLNDGVKVDITPLLEAGVFRYGKVVS
jgi:bifunctional DNA-binding transcriptional regulator/antitoxin component of YhaV-PrlF toxin-antitoxin module